MARDPLQQFIDGLASSITNYTMKFVESQIPKPARANARTTPTPKVPKPPKQPKAPKGPKAKREKQGPRIQTHYETLEVHHAASPETISAAYRSLCQRNHPDKFPNDAKRQAWATERTKAFTEAYAVLKDSEKRKAYDASLRG